MSDTKVLLNMLPKEQREEIKKILAVMKERDEDV